MSNLINALTTLKERLEATISNSVSETGQFRTATPSYEVEIYNDILSILGNLGEGVASDGATETTLQSVATLIDEIKALINSAAPNIDVPLSQVGTEVTGINNTLGVVQVALDAIRARIDIPLSDVATDVTNLENLLGNLETAINAIEGKVSTNIDIPLSNVATDITTVETLLGNLETAINTIRDKVNVNVDSPLSGIALELNNAIAAINSTQELIRNSTDPNSQPLDTTLRELRNNTATTISTLNSVLTAIAANTTATDATNISLNAVQTLLTTIRDHSSNIDVRLQEINPQEDAAIRLLTESDSEYTNVNSFTKTFTSPAGKIWLVQSLGFRYAADADPEARKISVDLGTLTSVNSRYEHQENESVKYNLALNGRDSTVIDGSDMMHLKLPPIKLPPATIITFSATNSGMADSISEVFLSVQEWEVDE